jgi:hypothetical protein
MEVVDTNFEYTGALSVGLVDLCDYETCLTHEEYVLTEDVDFAIIINNLN